MQFTLLAFEHPENYRAQRILTVANYANVKLGLKHAAIPASETFKLHCSPLGGNPVLETPDGHIFETNAIMRFLARKASASNLYGKSEFDHAIVDAWLDFSNCELDPLVTHIYGVLFHNKPLPEDWVASCDTVFASIEQWLETRTFLVAERVSMADICIAFALQIFYRKSGHGEYFAEKFPNVFRLYNAVMHQPQTLAALTTIGGTFGVVKKTA